MSQIYMPKWLTCMDYILRDIALSPLLNVHLVTQMWMYRHQFQPKQGGVIGIVLTAINYEAYRNDEFNHQAVERAFAFNIAWVMDPLVYGEYPPLMRKYLEDDLPKFSKEETDLVKGSVDFFGINHYSSLYAIDCLHYPSNCTTKQDRAIRGFVGLSGYQDGIPIGEKMGVHNFFVVPRGMENIIDYVRMRYPNIAIYMTENGYSPPQEDLTNKLEDFKRIKYHKAYLAALSNAIRKGAKVKGYFAWTFMDNFEWISGYDITFGLYYVDRRTLKRTPKFSARWYAHFLANKTLPLLECQFPAPKLVSTH